MSNNIVEILAADNFVAADRPKLQQFLADVVLDSQESAQTIAAIRALLKNFGKVDWIAATALDIVKNYPDAAVREATLRALIENGPQRAETKEAVIFGIHQREFGALRLQTLQAIAKQRIRWPWALDILNELLAVEPEGRFRSALLQVVSPPPLNVVRRR